MFQRIRDGYKPIYIVVGLLGIAYLWGVLSTQHYLPSGGGFYVDVHVALFWAAALIMFFMWRAPQRIQQISVGCIYWLLLFALLCIQPLINSIVYVDALLFPVASILLCALTAWMVTNFTLDEKQTLILGLAWALLIGGVLMVCSQLVQLWQIKPLLGTLVFDATDIRPVGNIAQVNQAVFVVMMGAAAAVFLPQYCLFSIRLWGVWWLLLVFLGMGVGFSVSRGGLFLAVAVVLSTGLFYDFSWRHRMLRMLAVAVALFVGYWAGTEMLHAAHPEYTVSAIDRVVGENRPLRTYLLHQSWLAFSEHWFAGVGFDNFKQFGLQQAQQLKWFTVAHHAHNLVAQMGAELGILGLLVLAGFAFVLLKNWRWRLSAEKAFAYAVLLLIVLYSFSEFPLWYLRFLLLTALFIGLVDHSRMRMQLKLGFLALIASVMLLAGSTYYLIQYQPYRAVAYMLKSETLNHEQKIAAFKTLPPVFGFSQYRELMLFMLRPITEEQLPEQIALGERVLSVYLDQFLMLKQANLLAIAGREAEADALYQAACIFNFAEECSKVREMLTNIAAENPALYQAYLDRFEKWHRQFESEQQVQ